MEASGLEQAVLGQAGPGPAPAHTGPGSYCRLELGKRNETEEIFSTMSARACLFASRIESKKHKSSTVNMNLGLK